ncbi:MAG: hypothetical protein ACPGWR_22380 [Ardenticatenaceae bacterium]
MSDLTKRGRTRSRREKLLTIALIVCGVLLVGYFGLRVARGFLLFRTQPLKPGITDVQAIRPWMTIRYIGVAYAVPEEYLFFQLDIPFDNRTRDDTLGRLNRHFEVGEPKPDEPPPIINKVQEAIKRYQEEPVATGLDQIRAWMSVQYIANATGVPAAYIFESIGLPLEEANEYMLLRDLDGKYRYGGPRQLIEAIQEAIAQYEAQAPAPAEGENE